MKGLVNERAETQASVGGVPLRRFPYNCPIYMDITASCCSIAQLVVTTANMFVQSFVNIRFRPMSEKHPKRIKPDSDNSVLRADWCR